MQPEAPSLQSKAPSHFSGLDFCFYLSLAFLAAVVFLWIRSWTVRDTLPIKHAGQQWEIVSFRGHIAIDNELQQFNVRLGIVNQKVRAERDYFNARSAFDNFIKEPRPEEMAERFAYFRRGQKLNHEIAKSSRTYIKSLTISFPPSTATRSYSWPYCILIIPLSIPGMFCVLGALRRMRRRYRGHCVLCGYDLRASPERCPECGCETA